MVAFLRKTGSLGTGSLDVCAPGVLVVPVGMATLGGPRGASASASSALVAGLEGVTGELTTITDLAMGPRGTRDALDVRMPGLVPLSEIPVAPELLSGFADAFSNLRAVSSLSDLFRAGGRDFRLLFVRIVKERGSVCELFRFGFACAALLDDLMVATANGDRATVLPGDPAGRISRVCTRGWDIRG